MFPKVTNSGTADDVTRAESTSRDHNSGHYRSMDLICKLILLVFSIARASCQFCEPVTIDSCSSAGYKFTARFQDVGGQTFQNVQASRLNVYVPLLMSTCSNFASTILCSLYIPKCEEGISTPQLPCREVCSKFVGDCFYALRAVGLAGLVSSLCDLLPNNGQQCFYPENFPNISSSGGELFVVVGSKFSKSVNNVTTCGNNQLITNKVTLNLSS